MTRRPGPDILLRVAAESRLIVQVPRGSAVDLQLSQYPPTSVSSGVVAVDRVPPNEDGALGPPEVGEVVLSVPSPETLSREAGHVSQLLEDADPGPDPLVIVVEVAEELREDELIVVVGAAAAAPRAVLLRVDRSI
jgi:hypothetical protein